MDGMVVNSIICGLFVFKNVITSKIYLTNVSLDSTEFICKKIESQKLKNQERNQLL